MSTIKTQKLVFAAVYLQVSLESYRISHLKRGPELGKVFTQKYCFLLWTIFLKLKFDIDLTINKLPDYGNLICIDDKTKNVCKLISSNSLN